MSKSAEEHQQKQLILTTKMLVCASSLDSSQTQQFYLAVLK